MNFYEIKGEGRYNKKRALCPLCREGIEPVHDSKAIHFMPYSKLGLKDNNVHRLAEGLIHWQWADGGWETSEKGQK